MEAKKQIVRNESAGKVPGSGKELSTTVKGKDVSSLSGTYYLALSMFECEDESMLQLTSSIEFERIYQQDPVTVEFYDGALPPFKNWDLLSVISGSGYGLAYLDEDFIVNQMFGGDTMYNFGMCHFNYVDAFTPDEASTRSYYNLLTISDQSDIRIKVLGPGNYDIYVRNWDRVSLANMLGGNTGDIRLPHRGPLATVDENGWLNGQILCALTF